MFHNQNIMLMQNKTPSYFLNCRHLQRNYQTYTTANVPKPLKTVAHFLRFTFLENIYFV